MRKSNPSGFHSKLTPEVHKKIISSIEKGYVQNHIAAIAMVHPRTFDEWIKRGHDEAHANISSPFAQLYTEYANKRAEIAGGTVTVLLTRPKNFTALQWFLERVYRDEYGVDSDMIKELANNILKLAEQKGSNHGKIECSKTEENTKE